MFCVILMLIPLIVVTIDLILHHNRNKIKYNFISCSLIVFSFAITIGVIITVVLDLTGIKRLE